MIAPSPIHNLRQQIEDLRIDGANHRQFVPEGHLDNVITRDSIRNIVADFVAFQNEQEVIDFIIKRARKIFSILVLIEDVESIQHFIRADQFQSYDVDALLPMSNDALQRVLPNERVVKRFYEKQWEFCVPVFDTRIIPRTLEPRTILPYLSENYLNEGAFGRVYRINIHPKHRPLGYEDTGEFVRKEILLDNNTYDNEVYVLSVLKKLEHPNILKLIACYTYGEHHNIICPFIPNGSLRKWLELEKCQTLTHAYMFQLISGLVSAIWALHELVVGDAQPHKGHHQDLRPDNVLYDGNNLILADFGLSSIKSPNEVSRTPFKHIPGYCKAPECMDLQAPFKGHNTTRATDIFALGCIIADMIVYLVKGPDGVKRFAHDRQFKFPPVCFSLFHKGDTGNHRVAEFLQEISDEDRSETLKSSVALVSQMLEIDPTSRPLARDIAAQFYMITVRAYLEQFNRTFDSFKHSPDAIIEAARFQSWTTALDETHFTNAAGPTQTARMFTSVIEKVKQFEITLKGIDKDDPNLDRRAFIELRQLNDELLNTLPQNRIEIANNHLSSIVLHKIGNDPEDSVYRTLIASFGEESGIIQGVNTKQLVAQMNQLRASTEMPPPSFNMIPRALSHIDDVGGYQIAKVKGNPSQPAKYVLVESIKYQDQHRRKKLLSRVHALCKLLSCQDIQKQLCVLPFYGLQDKPNSFAFKILYDLSAAQGGEDVSPNPINLQSLLEHTKPTLETRFKLAFKLAESLAAFHDVDWYHKDLTCFSILFLRSEDDVPTWMKKPYLVGFQHSRRSVDEFSEGPQQDRSHHRYHDPRYITNNVRYTQNFQPHFDYYSLGIVLLEIGLWNTIGKEMQGHEQKDNAHFSKVLIEDKLPKLAHTMSSKYVSAVSQCLTGWQGDGLSIQTNGGSSIEAKLLFRSKVVAPLRDLCSIFSPVNSPPTLDPKRKRANSYGFATPPKRIKTE